MPDTIEALKGRAIESKSWSAGDDAMNVYRLTHNAILVEMRGAIPDEATDLLDQGLFRFIEDGGSITFWDVFELDQYSSGIRNKLLDFTRNNGDKFHVLHVGAGNSSWKIKMAINLVNLALKGRVRVHKAREAFNAEVDRAIGQTPGS